MATTNSPLQKVDLTNINNALKSLLEMNQHMSNAASVGLDMTDFQKQSEYYTNLWNQYKNTYFPQPLKG